jgi:predicted exporter
LSARTALGVWLAVLALAAWLVWRTPVGADLSAFLPRSPTPAQQLLVDELREGVVSRLLLLGIEGAPPQRLAALSGALRGRLAAEPAFAYVNNGAQALLDADGKFLLEHRYVLSSGVTPERFSAGGLRSALQDNLALLASPTSIMLTQMLPADPTGELLTLLERLQAQAGPNKREGVWFSPDGTRALLVVQTHAQGFDLDGQQEAVGRIRAAFAQAASGEAGARLLLSGPGVFAVEARATIAQDAARLAGMAVGLIAVLLLVVFRSVRVLGLTLLPVLSGTIVGAAAVAVGFDAIHGVTLGFGVTMIGEAVDYAIYLFTHMGHSEPADRALRRLWPTLTIGVLTSVVGFGAMIFSGFPGLAQLGVFSIAGLITAVLVTRFVLPALMPARFNVRSIEAVALPVLALGRMGRSLRIPLLLALVVAAGWLAWQGDAVWDDNLESLSPVPQADKALDRSLRQDLGAPDVRQLVVVPGGSADDALQRAETVGEALDRLRVAGALAGFDSPAHYLPSAATQRARRAALQDAQTLQRNLAQAGAGLPFRADAFDPFLEEVEAARRRPPLTRDDLRGTGFALKLDSLLVERRGSWFAVLPLRGVSQEPAIVAALAGLPDSDALLLDLKRESDALYGGYRGRALTFSLLGAGAIALLLLVSLRSVRRALEVIAPLAAAVTATCAILTASGVQLNLFHLVALLLVVGVGSNYSLFFERETLAAGDARRTLAAVFLCNLSTVIGFGMLAFSRSPVLSAMGLTVALGTILTLVLAAVLAGPAERRMFK